MPQNPRFFSQGKEFSLIESLYDKTKFSKGVLGDDAFIFRHKGDMWAVSTDTSLEDVHYNLKWSTPAQALEKAFLANLSDLHAVGASCEYLLLNLGASKGWRASEYRQLKQTIKKMEKKHKFQVSGGDTVLTKSNSFFSITALGRLRGRPLFRKNARPGQRLYLSGPLGKSAAGLNFLKKGEVIPFRPNLKKGSSNRLEERKWVQHHLVPRVSFTLGMALSQMKTQVAAIDVSDGLSSELWHLSRQSGCRMVVEWDKLPMPDWGSIPQSRWSKWVLHGGEEYVLLFSGKFSSDQLLDLRRTSPVYEIGYTTKGKGVVLREKGSERILDPKGWVHA